MLTSISGAWSTTFFFYLLKIIHNKLSFENQILARGSLAELSYR